MPTFHFSIIASGPDPEAADFETMFYESGCDDALISLQGGRIVIDFARQADSLDLAIDSAKACVIAAGARIESVDLAEPDALPGVRSDKD